MSHQEGYKEELSLMSDRAIAAELAGRLKRTRLNANLTQAELAARSGLSLRTVIRAESGETGTTILALIALLRALGKLDSLDSFLPAPPPSPLMARERETPYRRRASKPRKATAPETGSGWKWGDET
jgi:transcriptional regulator with XRE-family HTH domain